MTRLQVSRPADSHTFWAGDSMFCGPGWVFLYPSRQPAPMLAITQSATTPTACPPPSILSTLYTSTRPPTLYPPSPCMSTTNTPLHNRHWRRTHKKSVQCRRWFLSLLLALAISEQESTGNTVPNVLNEI